MVSSGDIDSSSPPADSPPAPTIEEAFADFASVGIPTLLTLLDAINDGPEPMRDEIKTILFGVVGVYCHSLRDSFIKGDSPLLSHQVGAFRVMSDPRVGLMVQMAMEMGTNDLLINRINDVAEDEQ